MTGQLDILSCGDGHIEIKFHQNDVVECARAKRIIEDMLKRGYALFIHGKDDALIRVKKFLGKTAIKQLRDLPDANPSSQPAPA